MSILVVNPQLLFNPKDKFTTGIVYLPIAIASISANLKKHNIQHKVIDLFGIKPKEIKRIDNFLIIGDEIINYEAEICNSKAVFIFANQVINHISIIKIIKQIRTINKEVKIFTFENTQAVTAYSLKEIYNDFIRDEEIIEIL